MDRHQRLQTILHELEKSKMLEVDEVGVMLDISPATVRRDFNYLAKHYGVDKTWGGISLSTTKKNFDTMVPLQQRRTENIKAKKAIAEKAASLVKDGEIIFIDGGTTTLEMIPHLAERKIKIITNSILIAQRVDLLSSNFVSEVFLTGGLLYPASGLVVGPQALECIQDFNADWTFLSVGGIAGAGATNSNVLVVETEKAMIRQSEKTAILADSSKFGKKDLVKICDLGEVDFLITESGTESDRLPDFQQDNITLMTA
jgi:DeoR/GlpR family transcriptional regulator of sugar metabolism